MGGALIGLGFVARRHRKKKPHFRNN
jgi:hypothetical protein